MPDMSTIEAEGNSDDAALALRLKFVGQELIMASGAIERAKEQLEPILDTAKMRAEELQRGQGNEYRTGLDRALQIVDKYIQASRLGTGEMAVLALVHQELLEAVRETRS